MIEERESEALADDLQRKEHVLATSRIAVVEVCRAVAIQNPSPEASDEVGRLLQSCLLVNVSDLLLRAAATLEPRELRALDAIHLATALHVQPDEVLTYDRRLRDAALAVGLTVSQPGR